MSGDLLLFLPLARALAGSLSLAYVRGTAAQQHANPPHSLVRTTFVCVRMSSLRSYLDFSDGRETSRLKSHSCSQTQL